MTNTPSDATQKNTPKIPVPLQRPPMGGPKMAMNSHNKWSKPWSNFAKPARIMRASKGR